MPNPPRPDLVHKAICAGIFGNIEWQSAAYQRVRRDPDMQGLTPEAIRHLLREHVKDGNALEIREETREEKRLEDPENPYWYRAVIPVAAFSHGLFVEVILLDHDEEEPFVQIVNAHPQSS
jgi:hypothetical protein